MAICPVCGSSCGPGKFCGKCGSRIPKVPASATPESNKTKAEKSGSPQKPAETGATSPQTTEEIEELTKALRKNPASPKQYLLLAEALLKGGKADKAFSTFRAAKAIAPDSIEVLLLGARILETLGRKEQAILTYREVFQIDPANLQVALEMARLLFETGNRQRALKILLKLQARAEDHPEILLKIAEIQLSLGDASSAQEDLQAYRKLAGESLEMFYLLGRAMLSQGFYDGAIRHYRDGLARYPDDATLHLGLGKAYLGISEKGQALLEFERASQKVPDKVELLLEMGKLYGEMGLADKCEEAFDAIRRKKNPHGEIFLEMARFFQTRSDFSNAVQDLERAKKCSPHHPEVIRTLGEVLEQKGEQERALTEYEAFLDGMPETPWALLGVIRTGSALNDFHKVEKAQKKFIQLGNQTPDAWCDLGETLIRLGKFEEAKLSFEKAAALDPTCVRAYQAPELIKIEKARAEGEKLAGEAKEAVSKKFWLSGVDKLEKALELVPRETKWLRLLAEVNLKIGSISRAGERLSKVRAVQSQDFWVGYQLARVFEFEEKVQLAIELLSSILKDHPLELEGHLTLLRLKRSQIQGERFQKDMLSAIVRNVQSELSRFQKTSPVPHILEGYTYFIFGMGTKFQLESLKRAEEIFEELLYRFGDQVQAHKGLALIYRTRGDYKKAVHHLEEIVKMSADPGTLYALARINENFQNFSEARKFYTSLRSLFPENGLHRRRVVEMIAKETDSGGKDELVELLNSYQEKLRSEPAQVWLLYDMAWIQTQISRRSPQKEEWSKRALLTWNKANSQEDVSPWIRWGIMEAQLEFLKGGERIRAHNQNLKMCERMAREFPDLSYAHAYLGICFLGFEDLAQTDRAIKHLDTACFLDPSSAELQVILARSLKSLGKTNRVDLVRQNMILLEPELAMKV